MFNLFSSFYSVIIILLLNYISFVHSFHFISILYNTICYKIQRNIFQHFTNRIGSCVSMRTFAFPFVRLAYWRSLVHMHAPASNSLRAASSCCGCSRGPVVDTVFGLLWRSWWQNLCVEKLLERPLNRELRLNSAGLHWGLGALGLGALWRCHVWENANKSKAK